MKITDWTIYTPDKNYHVFLEIHTDKNISGWGSAYSEKNQVVGAFAWLKRFVMNENPLEIEQVTEKLHQITFWIGRGGAMTHAISAINLALWDIAGKAQKKPVHSLLDGKKAKKTVQTYGSVLFSPVSSLEQRIEKMLELGFRAIKLGWDPFCRQSLKEDEKLIRSSRKYAGNDITIMVDAGGSYPFWKMQYKDALARARMLADYNVFFFEEPLNPDDIEGYKRLTEASPVIIAHGEVLTRRQSYEIYFKQHAMDIAQPDCTKVGGLSESMQIASMARKYGIEIIPHGWNTAIGVAADIHFVSTFQINSFVEFNVGNELIEEIAEPKFKLDKNGCRAVPETPGFGIEIDREKLHRRYIQ